MRVSTPAAFSRRRKPRFIPQTTRKPCMTAWRKSARTCSCGQSPNTPPEKSNRARNRRKASRTRRKSRRFGLLGVLPHVAESVTHCARWTLGERYNPELQFMAETIQHYRAHGRWFTKVLHCSFDDTENLGKPKEGEPLPRAPGYLPRCPGARMRHIEIYGEESGLTEEDLLETWCDFFPSIPKSKRLTHTYPQPLTADFWRIYEEPLEVFLRHALIFLCAVSSCPQYLQALLEPVGISLERKED